LLATLPDHPIAMVDELMPWAWKARIEATSIASTTVAHRRRRPDSHRGACRVLTAPAVIGYAYADVVSTAIARSRRHCASESVILVEDGGRTLPFRIVLAATPAMCRMQRDILLQVARTCVANHAVTGFAFPASRSTRQTAEVVGTSSFVAPAFVI
jgi:hypothetical protein